MTISLASFLVRLNKGGGGESPMKKKITIELELDADARVEMYQAVCSKYNLIPYYDERRSTKERSLGRCLVEAGRKLRMAGLV